MYKAPIHPLALSLETFATLIEASFVFKFTQNFPRLVKLDIISSITYLLINFMEFIKAPPSKAAEGIFFYAASNSKASDIIKLIKEKEVNIDSQNVNGTTALYMACAN